MLQILILSSLDSRLETKDASSNRVTYSQMQMSRYHYTFLDSFLNLYDNQEVLSHKPIRPIRPSPEMSIKHRLCFKKGLLILLITGIQLYMQIRNI